MLLRNDLHILARERLGEARHLLRGRYWSGAYYLAGIGIECAIKACIAKKRVRYEFPDKGLAEQCFKHDLASLIRTAGLQQELDRESKSGSNFGANWTLVKDWDVSMRYNHSIAEQLAKDMLAAATQRQHGVFAWLRRHW